MSRREFGQVPGGAAGAVERMVDMVVLGEAVAARRGELPLVADYESAMLELYPPEHLARRALEAAAAAAGQVLAAATPAPGPTLDVITALAQSAAAIAAADLVASVWAKELVVVAAVIVYPLARTLAEHDGTSVGQALAGLIELMRGDPQ